MVFPLLYIFSGNLISSPLAGRRTGRVFLLLLGICLVASILSYFPHHISYFNEIVRDRKTGYRYLAGTNINWGQNRWYRNRYLEAHPEVIRDPATQQAGRILVNVNRLVAVYYPDRFRWLRENFDPFGHVAYSYLVFEVREEDLAKISGQRESGEGGILKTGPTAGWGSGEK